MCSRTFVEYFVFNRFSLFPLLVPIDNMINPNKMFIRFEENTVHYPKFSVLNFVAFVFVRSIRATKILIDFVHLAPPKFPDGEDSTSVDVNEGSPLHIHCKIVAVPMPELVWYKDGNPIQTNDDVYIFPGGRTLQIISAK